MKIFIDDSSCLDFIAIARDLYKRAEAAGTKHRASIEGYTFIVEPEQNRITILSPDDITGFIFHPRTGVFGQLPIYRIGGQVIYTYGVVGGGWYPEGADPSVSPIQTPLPRNDQTTLNSEDGEALQDETGDVIEWL